MSRDHILPLPLYVHYAEMEDNMRVSEIYEDSDRFHLEKLTPMRIFGTILEIHGDETISFQWGKDKRNLQEYQKTLNQFYDVQSLEKNINLKEETTYIVHYDDNYYRCRVVDVYSIGDTKTVYLIDYGKTVKIDDADFFYFHHEESWSDESLCFAFAGICRIADKNQCSQLGIPLVDQFVPGEEVEIFLLSAQEPYYSVVSSLRNTEAKVLDDALTADLSPDLAYLWAEVTGNQLAMEPAERPTLSLSPKWIHGTNPVLVTIPCIEDLNKVAVCDLLCSLRACILSEILRDNYEKPQFQSLSASEHLTEIGIGVIVVAFDPKTKRYYRARICEINASMTIADLVGIDFPQWKSFNHPLTTLWLLSASLANLPRMLHYVPLQRDFLSLNSDTKLLLNELVGNCCESNCVALLQHKNETLEPEIIIADSANNPRRLVEYLPFQDVGMSRSLSTLSLSRSKKSKMIRKWSNKSAKKPVEGFKMKADAVA